MKRYINSTESSRFAGAAIRCSVVFGSIAFLALSNILFVTPGHAKVKEKVLYAFTGGNDGKYAGDSVVFDGSGNVYGVASSGGSAQHGVVFELSPSGGSWKETVLYDFQGGKDGAGPHSGLMFDSLGNLVGVTASGGGNGCFSGCGTIFQMHLNKGGKWAERVLYRFTGGADGGVPSAALIHDSAGNMYGTTQQGGDPSCSCGTVFELEMSGGKWREKVLYAFTGRDDGSTPLAALTMDSAGILYGTASTAGKKQFGVVFQLTPQSDGRWKQTILHAFAGGRDGAFPAAGVTFDSSSSLFGTTYAGGDPTCTDNGCGTIFRLTRNKGQWNETILHRFHGKDGIETLSSPLIDAAGNVFVTTFEGGNGACGVCGTAVELSPGSGGKWKETVLHDFGSTKNDGGTPEGSVVFNRTGSLFGTTFLGGTSGFGTVFEITP